MDKLEEKYNSLEPALRRLDEESQFILRAALAKTEIKTHSVVSRVKSLQSLREKVARKLISDPFRRVDDLVGIRVVCLLRSDLQQLGQIVRDQFRVISEDNKLDGAEVETFGYQSVHFVVRLPSSCKGPRYQGLHSLRLEIQLRTLAMDAWASLSHYLDYKSEADVPRELRKDLFALSGLFYVADTHFELFYSARQLSKAEAQQSVTATPIQGRELNLDTVTAYLANRYPDRKHAPPQDISELIRELSVTGYSSLDKLHSALEASSEAFIRYETKHPPNGDEGESAPRFADIGVVRVSLAIADSNFGRVMGYPADDHALAFRRFVHRKRAR